MGEAKSTAELTIEDIQNQLNEEERLQLLNTNQPPIFMKGLRSCEARINEDFRFTVQGNDCKFPYNFNQIILNQMLKMASFFLNNNSIIIIDYFIKIMYKSEILFLFFQSYL